MDTNNLIVSTHTFVPSLFTPLFRPRHGTNLNSFNERTNGNNLTTFTKRVQFLPVISCQAPQIETEAVSASNDLNHVSQDEDKDVDDIDDSWRVYSRPGNMCVICRAEGSTKCLYCFGEGVVRVGPEAIRDTITCPQCNGTAKEICPRCDGTGVRPETTKNAEGEVFRNPTNAEICANTAKENDVLQPETTS